jgi:hypothetical protein
MTIYEFNEQVRTVSKALKKEPKYSITQGTIEARFGDALMELVNEQVRYSIYYNYNYSIKGSLDEFITKAKAHAERKVADTYTSTGVITGFYACFLSLIFLIGGINGRYCELPALALFFISFICMCISHNKLSKLERM